MRALAFLDTAEKLPMCALGDLLGGSGAVIVAPHPDDESLGCGALIARMVAEGRPLRIVIVSDGAGSHPNSKSYPLQRLRELRESEARAAGAALGLDPSHIAFLGLPDRYVPAVGSDAEGAAAAIAAHARDANAGALFVTWRHDPHADHQAAYVIARLAQRRMPVLRLFEYSIWGRSLPSSAHVPETPKGWRLRGSATCARKRAAIACHRSQTTMLIDDDPKGFCLDPAHIARLERSEEIFLEMAP
jgi:LmbE family N-acetylglucosaminyl deacetylase